MIRRLYDWTLALAGHRHSTSALCIISFLESFIFPIPTDLMLAPMVLARRSAAMALAFWCTVSSVFGGVAGYLIGVLFFAQIAQPVLQFYGFMPQYESLQGGFQDHAAWIVFLGGLTPFPYKVVTIASGAARIDLVVFVLASVISRAIRYFSVAGLLYVFGPTIRRFLEKYLGWVFAAFLALVFLSFWLFEAAFAGM